MDDPIVDYQKRYEWKHYPEGMPTRLRKLHMRTNRLKRVFQEGQEGALYDALVYAFAYGDIWDKDVVLAPRWALTAAAYCVAHYLRFAQKKGNHRYSKDLIAYPQYEEHYKRYETVDYLIHSEQHSTETAFEKVATDLNVSASTVKDSYYKLKKLENARERLLEFFPFFLANDFEKSEPIADIYNRKEAFIPVLQDAASSEEQDQAFERWAHIAKMLEKKGF